MPLFEDGRIDVRLKQVQYKTERTVLPYFEQPGRPTNGFAFYMKNGHHFKMKSGMEYSASEYDLVYIPYGATYINRVSEPRIEYYQIDFEIYKNGEQISLFDDLQIIRSAEGTALLPYFLEIYNLYAAKPRAYQLKALSILLHLIALVSDEQAEADEKSRAGKRISAALTYLNGHYAEDTEVSALAEMTCLSISGLEKNFIKSTGMTPIAYRNSIRIAHAKKLLLGGFPISEVWERVGFSDLYYFAKTFKKYTGITPGQFLKESSATM